MGCYSRNQAQHKLLKSVYTQVDLLFMYVFRQQLEMTAQFSPQHHSHIAFPVAYHTSVFVLVFWKFEGRGNILNNPVSRTWYNLRKLFLEIQVISTLFWPVGIRGSDQQAYAEAREVQSGSKEKLFHHEGSQTLEQSAQGKLCLSFLLKILHINIQRDSWNATAYMWSAGNTQSWRSEDSVSAGTDLELGREGECQRLKLGYAHCF